MAFRKGLSNEQIQNLLESIEDNEIDNNMITTLALDDSDDSDYEIDIDGSEMLEVIVEEDEQPGSDQVIEDFEMHEILETEEEVNDANVTVEQMDEVDLGIENVDTQARPRHRKILTPNRLVNSIDAALDPEKYNPVVLPEEEIIYEAVMKPKKQKKILEYQNCGAISNKVQERLHLKI